jgi:hypothetical protein
MDLYHATGGPGWKNASGWGSVGVGACAWAGVECSAGGARVLNLWLGQNNLVGTIPASIVGLSALEILCVQAQSVAARHACEPVCVRACVRANSGP